MRWVDRHATDQRLQNLETCWDGIVTYLQGKRDELPELYFVPSHDLPAVYGSLSHPQLVNRAVFKLFDNIRSIDVEEVNFREYLITSMTTIAGEVLELNRPIPYIGSPRLCLIYRFLPPFHNPSQRP